MLDREKCAVILAGGKGTRLRPYTVVLPKPLVPVGDYPILEVVIRQLVHFGFRRVVIAVNHLAEIIQAFFGDGSKWGARIEYSFEEIPLGTMGPLKLIRDLPKHFLLMNGDILTDLNFGSFLEEHVRQERLFSISAYERQVATEYGVLDVGDDGVLTGFREKPLMSFRVSMGIYAASRRVSSYIPESGPYGFDDLMLRLVAERQRVHVIPFAGKWLDIGRPDDYALAVDEFSRDKDVYLRESEP